MPFSVAKSLTRANDNTSPFGLAEKWRCDQLPTRQSVGRYYLLKRKEMESERATVPTTREVSKEVVDSLTIIDIN